MALLTSSGLIQSPEQQYTHNDTYTFSDKASFSPRSNLFVCSSSITYRLIISYFILPFSLQTLSQKVKKSTEKCETDHYIIFCSFCFCFDYTFFPHSHIHHLRVFYLYCHVGTPRFFIFSSCLCCFVVIQRFG